jgi:hypothetical protein
MGMEPGPRLNHTRSKFFVKMIGIEGFQNPKNGSQDQTKGPIKNKKIKTTTQRFLLKSKKEPQ